MGTFSAAIRLDGGEWVDAVIEVPDGRLIEGYELKFEGMPIVAQPFSLHDRDFRRYHTVCRRVSDEIDELEW